MICILSLLVFSVLGIFSASHRLLAREALDCVFRRLTLRPCQTGFNEKIKSQIVGKLLLRSEKLAKLANRYFELLSWLFFLAFLLSFIWMARGVYNFYLYGSCNGLNAAGFCAFDPTGENNKVTNINNTCSLNPPSEKDLRLDALDLSLFPQLQTAGEDQVVFIGCYSCDYTRKAYPIIQKLRDRYDFDYIFVHFPVKNDTAYISNYLYCLQQSQPEKIWDLNNQLFAGKKDDIAQENYLRQILQNLQVDLQQLDGCLNDQKTQAAVDQQLEQILATNIYGTPTIFINGRALVGPKPYRVYQRMLGKWW